MSTIQSGDKVAMSNGENRLFGKVAYVNPDTGKFTIHLDGCHIANVFVIEDWTIEKVLVLPSTPGSIISAPSGRFVRTAYEAKPWLGIDGHTEGSRYQDHEFGPRTTVLYDGEPRN